MFDAIGSQFLSVVRVPRSDDYGIDAYCHIRRPLDQISSTVGSTFGVQVHGPGRHLQFGGMNVQGHTWKAYEIEWLRSLAVPYYLARVNAECTRVDFYALWPVWIVLATSPNPFRIVCECSDLSPRTFVLSGATREVDGSHGDRTTWTVSLGPPFLSVTQGDLGDQRFKKHAADLMGMWVGYDRITVINLLLRVPYFRGIGEWPTNDFDFSRKLTFKEWLGWGSTRGHNIDDLCKAFEPVTTSLGRHLQCQNDPAAYTLIPALEWLQSNGRLSGFGTKLLSELKETQAQGTSPRPPE